MSNEEITCRSMIAEIRRVSRKDADAMQKELDVIVTAMNAAMADVLPWRRIDWHFYYRRQLAVLIGKLARWPMDGSIMPRGNQPPKLP